MHMTHGLPYFISSSGVMQFRKVCFTVVLYVPYILLQIYTITNLATFGVTIFDIFFTLGPSLTQYKTHNNTDQPLTLSVRHTIIKDQPLTLIVRRTITQTNH